MTRGRVLLDGDPVTSLVDHERLGGGEAVRLAGEVAADVIVDELIQSGLRGRGGAGFPAGVKWRSILAGGPAAGERFVVANGAEGEPGTFKDRAIIRHNPYLLVEGALVAARVVGARRVFIALKASFTTERALLQTAIEEVTAAGWAPEVSLELVAGPDEYLFGEEKALLEVIEGEEPLPRLFPPYVYGLFSLSPQVGWSAGRTLEDRDDDASNPTLVNNVETLSTVPAIVRHGADWYRGVGTAESPGTIVCTVSGDTVRHGVGEFELGTPVAEVIEELGGGMPPGRSIRYVLSGVANPVLRGDRLDTPLSHEGMESVGAGLGTGGFIVYDDRTDPIELAAAVSRFLWIESCGQCPACKLGTDAVTSLLEGGLAEGLLDLGTLSARLARVDDAARCYLPTQAQRVVGSLLEDIRGGVRGERRDLLVTKLVDLVDDRFVLDERQASKRPDWTYG